MKLYIKINVQGIGHMEQKLVNRQFMSISPFYLIFNMSKLNATGQVMTSTKGKGKAQLCHLSKNYGHIIL